VILTGHSVLSFLHYFDAVGCAAGNIRHVKNLLQLSPKVYFCDLVSPGVILEKTSLH